MNPDTDQDVDPDVAQDADQDVGQDQKSLAWDLDQEVLARGDQFV